MPTERERKRERKKLKRSFPYILLPFDLLILVHIPHLFLAFYRCFFIR